MHAKLLVSLLLLEAPFISAFPDMADRVMERELAEVEEIARRQEGDGTMEPGGFLPFPEFPGAPTHALYNKFNAKQQRVSTSGEHRFIAPKSTDIRGPCAGLNAAANHGYIPRDGIATAETINTGLFEAFGLDKSATLFLQTATQFLDGDPFNGKWSIGPYSPKTASLGQLQNLIGKQAGICEYGHLKTEGDSSITRGDWLAPQRNDNCMSYPIFAAQLFNLANKRGDGRLTPRIMVEHQYNRKQHSIATNPNYFSPAYAGVAFTFGAHMFAYELLANHSKAEPRGILTQDVFSSFFSYKRGPKGRLIQTNGHERIPDNWYKRADDDPWTLTDIAISTAQQCASYPSNCQVGGNTGKVNSFSGVNFGDVTGGFIQSAEDLQDPNKAGCFISQAIQADTPTFLDNVFSGAGLALAKRLIPTKLVPAMAGLGSCQNLPKGRSVTQYGAGFPGAIFDNDGPRGSKK